MIEIGVNPDENHLGCAILCGRPDFVQILIARGINPDEDHFHAAINSDDLDILKMLVEEGNFNPNGDDLNQQGKLAMFKYLISTSSVYLQSYF